MAWLPVDKVTLPPWQKEVGPPAVIVASGGEITSSIAESGLLSQPETVTVRKYFPAFSIAILVIVGVASEDENPVGPYQL